MFELPFVSIIIPAYNRAKMLGITIKSFVEQDYPKDKYEIIISDNNSTDNTKDVVLEWQSKSDVKIKYVFEKRQGVHYARNTAAKHSVGDILYYTDDDMIADRKLLSEIVRPFLVDPLVGSATGKVLPEWEVPPPAWVVKYCYNGWLSLNDMGEELRITDYDLGVYSCHQAMRRDVFFKSGGFNPENTAGEWIGDGETGINLKIKELGYKFAYNGKSLIYHMIPQIRMTQQYINKRLANQGNADSYTRYRKYKDNKFRLYSNMLSYTTWMLVFALKVLIKKILFNGKWRIDRAYISYYIARIKYDYRLIKDGKWREIALKSDWLNE